MDKLIFHKSHKKKKQNHQHLFPSKESSNYQLLITQLFQEKVTALSNIAIFSFPMQQMK